ncbi:calcium-binding protein [Microvirga alba]|uniref:Calcium-binding protein n=1 Tax=Microvirga alba TaxID=2791025 RepID=A0A931BP65_9HYPH|nr:calcium-binding protein [Microvirga alba]MBF9232770.1 calcium-binding protein [Microvirga alba]
MTTRSLKISSAFADLVEVTQKATEAGQDHVGTAAQFDIISYEDAPATATTPKILGLVASLDNAFAGIQTGWAKDATYDSIEGLTGSAFADTLIGNASDNMLIGGKGSDILIGGLGADTLNGSDGDPLDIDVASYRNATAAVEVYLGNAAANKGEAAGDKFISIEGIEGSRFNDLLVGDAGKNSISGGAGDDTIIGGAGGDTLDGGDGIDTLSFVTATAGVQASLLAGGGDGSNGVDSVGDKYSNFENMIGSAYADFLTGDSKDNLIQAGAGNDGLYAGAGNDTLDGGTGADNMQGQAGNDTYMVDDLGDVVIEAAGNGYDTVITSISLVLSGAEIEVLKAVAGTAPLSLTANSYNNLIIGNDAGNIIDGKGGADTMEGGNGNDIYYVDNAGDRVLETAKGGSDDKVFTSVSYTLDAYVEHLTAAGSSAIKLTGNELNNTLLGNSGANTINGGAGDDTIYGGLGKDALAGGAGKDVFVFDTKASSANVDKITDFNVKDDSIYLDNAIFRKLGKGVFESPGKLNKKFFTVGSQAKDKDDYVIYDKKAGVLYYDADGNGAGKAVAIATLSKNLKMTAADFFVI